ncbi:unnamed protein product [Rotaria sordida]|uniref:Uncharacterized protein n=1 Tax=Rotaria sordida TaxID=392033 RepID=A0A815LC70_9BILA|nr:unnamed protein product [Rotaria sordida]CAF1624794.1 unnamed protein product [Rotaria sordida]
MSDKFIPYHLRDINDPPAHLDDQQKANWISAAKKEPLRKEIYPVIVYQWFEWPIKTTVVNLQLKFADWYSWALSHCEMCSLSNRRNIIINDINSDGQMNLLSKYTCHKSSPYRPNEP